MTERRAHLATQWYSRDGSGLRCKCGWESDESQPMRDQREAHRAHRIEMGDTVKPLKPSKAERTEALLERLAQRLAAHAHCNTHPAITLDCPFCEDVAAYYAYLQHGGTDYRFRNDGPHVEFWQIDNGECVQ